MGWFSPSKDEVWRQLSEDIGAEFVARGFCKGGSKVQAHVGPWSVTLDTYRVRRHHHPDRHSHVTYTRMRAAYVKPDGFRFRIYRKGFFSDLGKLLGMQNIAVGDPEFEETFIIKGNSEARVRDLFANARIRQMIQDQPEVRLEVKDSKGWSGPRFPDDVDELHFEVLGVMKDVERLKALFDLFAAVLDQLCRIGSAYKEEAGVEM
jgi:hypothetical protein